MNDLWTSAGVWMLRTALGGGLLLLVTCVVMRWTPQPARRQRLGDWGILAALLGGAGQRDRTVVAGDRLDPERDDDINHSPIGRRLHVEG